MAIVLIDNEAFKATLQIVEDFINDDYDAFIENGPTDDIKLITWKMEIYFKRLEGKKKSIVEYYMLSIYKLIKVYLYQKNINYSSHITYIGHFNGSYPINSLTLDFKKNIPAKTITIKFICNETYKSNNGYNSSYLNHIQYILYTIKSMKDQQYIRECTLSYYKPNEIEFTNKSINLGDTSNVSWLKNIIKTHYQEILKNIEAYILYCKTEKIDIDFKKIVDRITFIKEYVRENYNITLV